MKSRQNVLNLPRKLQKKSKREYIEYVRTTVDALVDKKVAQIESQSLISVFQSNIRSFVNSSLHIPGAKKFYNFEESELSRIDNIISDALHRIIESKKSFIISSELT